MSSSVPDSAAWVLALRCPRCQNPQVPMKLVRGPDGTWFARLQCGQCQEKAFLQVEPPNFVTLPTLASEPPLSPNFQAFAANLEGVPPLEAQVLPEAMPAATHPLESPTREAPQPLAAPIPTLPPEVLAIAQKEWEEWLSWKKRYLFPYESRRKYSSRFYRGLAGFLILVALFFVLDEYHLLGIILENRSARQQQIQAYVQKLESLPCLSERMKTILNTVPILYTLESVYHNNTLQYGETGVYWGEIQIRIHRSNFWFFGLPKKSQLIETLIHEARHRVNPELGHSDEFYRLVRRDTQCVMQQW